MIICPNFSNPEVAREFEELKNATSEAAAYHIWSLNNGNAIDKAPNGALSRLFDDLLLHYKGDRVKAIRAKAKVYGNSFINWFGDWTGNATYEVYQGRTSELPDGRRYNYWSRYERDAKTYGPNVRKVRINPSGFLFKRELRWGTNLNGERVFGWDYSEEYERVIEEFKAQTGYDYFDILENGEEGLKKQNKFFEFLESKGYKGYAEFNEFELQGVEHDNPYTVTFGDNGIIDSDVSKVVDKNGEPLVVYHGSNTYGFTVFDPLRADDKRSLFFSDSRFIASTYTNFEPIRNTLVRQRLLNNNAIELIKKGDYEALQKLLKDTLDYSLPYPGRERNYDIRYSYYIDEKIGELKKELLKPNLSEEEALGIQADIDKLEDTMWFSNNYSLKIRKIPVLRKDGQKEEKIEIRIDDAWKKHNESSYFIEKGIVFNGTPEQLIEALQTETKTYDLFLNIKNPLILSNQNGEFGASNNWNEVVYGGEVYKTREISELAQKKGYDGVLFEGIIDHGGYKGDADLSPVTDESITYDYFHEDEDSYTGNNIYSSNVYIAYSSNQIKSATDNQGTTPWEGTFSELDNIYDIAESLVKQRLAEELQQLNQKHQALLDNFELGDKNNPIFMLDNIGEKRGIDIQVKGNVVKSEILFPTDWFVDLLKSNIKLNEATVKSLNEDLNSIDHELRQLNAELEKGSWYSEEIGEWFKFDESSKLFRRDRIRQLSENKKHIESQLEEHDLQLSMLQNKVSEYRQLLYNLLFYLNVNGLNYVKSADFFNNQNPLDLYSDNYDQPVIPEIMSNLHYLVGEEALNKFFSVNENNNYEDENESSKWTNITVNVEGLLEYLKLNYKVSVKNGTISDIKDVISGKYRRTAEDHLIFEQEVRKILQQKQKVQDKLDDIIEKEKELSLKDYLKSLRKTLDC